MADPQLAPVHPLHTAMVAKLAELEPALKATSAGQSAYKTLVALVERHSPAAWEPQRAFITCSECCCLAWPPPKDPTSMWSDVVYPCATIQQAAADLGLPVDGLVDQAERLTAGTTAPGPGPLGVDDPTGPVLARGWRAELRDRIAKKLPTDPDDGTTLIPCGSRGAMWGHPITVAALLVDEIAPLITWLLEAQTTAARKATERELVEAGRVVPDDTETWVDALAVLINPHLSGTRCGGSANLAKIIYADGWRRVATPTTQE